MPIVPKPVEPLVVVFDKSEEQHIDLTEQCSALIRAHSYLIIGFPEGTIPPDYSEQFMPPQAYLDYQEELRQRVRHELSDPNLLLPISREELNTGAYFNAMFFYEQQLLRWFHISEKDAMKKCFFELSREERRKLERVIKIPLLPVGIKIKKSPILVQDYNMNLMELLDLKRV